MTNERTLLNAEDLEPHMEWLRRLAFILVRDEDDADDIAQETWLKALEHRPDPSRSLRAWLATVARNLVRLRHRRGLRHGAVRSLVESDLEQPAACDVVTRTESLRRLVDALLELDEPFRTTVLLRYSDGLSGVQIAARDGVPAGTVRWRLKRGLDELRERLDEGGDGGRSALSAILLPVSQINRVAPEGVALSTGGLIMFLKAGVLTALAAIFLVSSAWILSRSDLDSPRDPTVLDPVGAGIARSPGADEAEERQPPVRTDPPPLRVEAESPPPVTGTLERTSIRVVDEGNKALGGAVVTRVDEDEEGRIVVTETSDTTGADGVATLEVPRQDGFNVMVVRREYASRIAFFRAKDEPVVTLHREALLYGRVLEFETQGPIEGARVRLFGVYRLPATELRETRTGVGGDYRIEGAPVGTVVHLNVERQHHAVYIRNIVIDQPDETRLDILVPRGASIRGLTVDAETGEPLAGVEVDYGPRHETDDAGRFEVHGLLEERCCFVLEKPGFCQTVWQPDRTTLDESLQVVIPMFRSCALEGVVLDEQGAPIPGVQMWCGDPHRQETPDPLRDAFPRYAWDELVILRESGHYTRLTDAEGRFRLAGLKPSSRPVQARALRFPGSRQLHVDGIVFDHPGETREVELRVPRCGAIEGTIRGSMKNIRAVRWRGPTMDGWADIDARGGYRLDGVEAGLVRLDVCDLGSWPIESAEVVVQAGEATRRHFLVEEFLGTVAGIVLTPQGEPVPGIDVHIGHDAGGRSSLTDEQGRFRAELSAERGTPCELEFDSIGKTFRMEQQQARVGDEDLVLILPLECPALIRIVDADTGVRLPRVIVDWEMRVDDRIVRPKHDTAWKPGLEGVGVAKLPVGTMDLTLDASLLGYPMRRIPAFEVTRRFAETVRTIRLRRYP